MALIERKRCNKCKSAGVIGYSLFLKEDPTLEAEEECITCSWRVGEELWIDRIGEVGLNQAKQEWEETRDSQLNQDIEKEMDFREEAQQEEYKAKINKLFAPQTYTEKKHCDKCQQETIHLKENEAEELEEECLPCGWKTLIEYWEKKKEKDGIECAKRQWEEIRDSELNQKILLELIPEEKTQWNELVKETNQLFVSRKKNKEEESKNPSFQQHLPYIVGVVGIVAVIGLIIVLVNNNRRRK